MPVCSYSSAPLSPLLHSLVPTCTSCGIKLQHSDPLAEGYYREPSTKPKNVRSEDLVANEAYLKLDEDDLQLLANSNSTSEPLFGKKALISTKKQPDALQCVRCRQAQYRSTFDSDQFSIENIDSVMSSIPPDGTVVYVVSATDFPMSLDPRVFLYRSASQILFVITKCDLLFPTNNLANKYGLTFFQDYLQRKYGVSRDNVVVTSGKTDWNLSRLLANRTFKDNSYLIGAVNSGKSTLLKALLAVSESMAEEKRFLSARERTKLEKQQDRLISAGKPVPSTMALRRQNLIQRDRTGPGASYMPGYTRGAIPHEVGSATLFDVPGFGQSKNVYSYLQPPQIKQLAKGAPTHKYGTYKSPYVTVKGGQCYTVGGLFYLVPPENAIVQVRNCINHKGHIFSNIERATELLANVSNSSTENRHGGLRNTFVVSSSSLDSLVRRQLPSFYGSIDLVVSGVGYVNLTPTGAHAPGPWTIHVPEGVHICVRQPITRYTTRTLAGRDAQGNPLKKEHWRQKSVTHVERYSGKAPFSSHIGVSDAGAVATTNDRYPNWTD